MDHWCPFNENRQITQPITRRHVDKDRFLECLFKDRRRENLRKPSNLILSDPAMSRDGERMSKTIKTPAQGRGYKHT
jgi:hypothetical protein